MALTRNTGPVPSEATSSAIEAAVVHELAAHGVRGLSIDGVARRAQVGKAAIYRRWKGKHDMVIDVVCRRGIEAAAAYPDTGTLDGDLRAALSLGVRQLRDPLVATIVPDLLAEGARRPEFASELHERMGRRRRALVLDVIERAVARGELSGGVDRALAADLVIAPLYWRLLVTREPFDEETDGKRLVTAIIAALRSTTDVQTGRA